MYTGTCTSVELTKVREAVDNGMFMLPTLTEAVNPL
jgi:hypothetical protein